MRVCLSNHHAPKPLPDLFNTASLQMSSFAVFGKWAERSIASESPVILLKPQINTTGLSAKSDIHSRFHYVKTIKCWTNRVMPVKILLDFSWWLLTIEKHIINRETCLLSAYPARTRGQWNKNVWSQRWLSRPEGMIKEASSMLTPGCNLKQSQIEFLVSCRVRRDLLSDRWKAFSYLELWPYSPIGFHKGRGERISNSSRLEFLLISAKSTCRLMSVSYWKRRDMQGISWELAVL